eukprot:357166-Chlamydomonas_euryale.AAC.10
MERLRGGRGAEAMERLRGGRGAEVMERRGRRGGRSAASNCTEAPSRKCTHLSSFPHTQTHSQRRPKHRHCAIPFAGALPLVWHPGDGAVPRRISLRPPEALPASGPLICV